MAEPSPLAPWSPELSAGADGRSGPGDTAPPRPLPHPPFLPSAGTRACVHVQEQRLFSTTVLLLMISNLKGITTQRAFPWKAGLMDPILQDQHCMVYTFSSPERESWVLEAPPIHLKGCCCCFVCLFSWWFLLFNGSSETEKELLVGSCGFHSL